MIVFKLGTHTVSDNKQYREMLLKKMNDISGRQLFYSFCVHVVGRDAGLDIIGYPCPTRRSKYIFILE